MKEKILLASLVFMFVSILSYGQGRYGDRSGYHSTVNYGYDDYNDGYRNNRNSNDRFYRYYDRMNRSDKKRLKRLIREYRERERRAWNNGHLSRREIDRLRSVEADIDRLLYRYSRRDSRYNSRYRSSCR